jgi:hypothetical protein
MTPVRLVTIGAAAGALVVSKLWLRLAPGSAVRWSLRGEEATPALAFARSVEEALRCDASRDTLVRAVIAIGARWPSRVTCLEQSIALVALLKLWGVPARVTIGVARSDRTMNAHACVESGGRVLLGGAQMEGLLALTSSSCRG